MKVTLVMVSSVNGRITDGDNPNVYSWTSKEDQAQFSSLIKSHEVIIMGRKTYEVAKASMKLSDKNLRIVMTRNPKAYASDQVTKQLEFTSESPLALTKRLKLRGYSRILVVGGNEINYLFLKQKLVTRLILTIEPVLFGRGLLFMRLEELQVKLRLLELKKLNVEGTLLLTYEVIA